MSFKICLLHRYFIAYPLYLRLVTSGECSFVSYLYGSGRFSLFAVLGWVGALG